MIDRFGNQLIVHFNEFIKKSFNMKIAENDAKMQLILAINNDLHVDFILDEVDRRARIFKRVWRYQRIGHRKTARHAAIDSVYQDVIRGYLS